MTIPSIRVLYESADFRVSLRETGSDVLVVAFSPMDWPERGGNSRHWGDVVANKLPFSWLAIDALNEHWFCDTKWQQIADLVSATAQRFALRVGYGHSMGAYAALKRSRDYFPFAILSFAPQCSIHPDDVGYFDKRYFKYFDPHLHYGMRLLPSDIVCNRALVFFDSGFDTDRKHVELIYGDNIVPVSVGYMRHNVIFAAKGAVPLLYLLMQSLRNDSKYVHEVHRYFRSQKKSTTEYYANLAYKLLRVGHNRWAMNVASRALELDSDLIKTRLVYLQAAVRLNLKDAALASIECMNIPLLSDGDVAIVARTLSVLGLRQQALAIMSRPSIIVGSDTKNLRSLAELLLSDGQVANAVQLLERSVALMPNDPHCLVHLAKALMKDRKAPEYDILRAVKLLKRATEIAPSELGFWRNYAFSLESSGDAASAFLTWKHIETLTELGERDRERFDRLRLKLYNNEHCQSEI